VIRPFSIYANKAFAGRDTIVAKGEPVQLHAHGGPNMVYTWSPATGLSSPSIENPVAILDRDQQYTLLAVTTEGCDSYSKIFIKRYQGPELYIPNAFTPNGDGLNDALRVFPVGIREFGSLSIYNRYGQLIFQTSDYHKGWDGTLNGTRLSSGNFVAVAKAIDYKGNVMLKKENVVLIR
jgi:gliding motility-associated-like protein